MALWRRWGSERRALWSARSSPATCSHAIRVAFEGRRGVVEVHVVRYLTETNNAMIQAELGRERQGFEAQFLVMARSLERGGPRNQAAVLGLCRCPAATHEDAAEVAA